MWSRLRGKLASIEHSIIIKVQNISIRRSSSAVVQKTVKV